MAALNLNEAGTSLLRSAGGSAESRFGANDGASADTFRQLSVVCLRGLVGCLVILSVACAFADDAAPAAANIRLEQPRLRLLLVGDSTVASYENPPADRPTLTGWGQVFGECFTDRVEVLNRARSGRSSKSFIREGAWDKALQEKPDYVFIQFGHNDMPGKGERSTDPDGDYRDYLRQYIDDARAGDIRPILVTPVARRTFKNGRACSTLGPYVEAMQAVARERQVPLVDLHAASMALFDRLGDEASADLSASEKDRTHFSHKGAAVIAALVAAALPDVEPSLTPFALVQTRPEAPTVRVAGIVLKWLRTDKEANWLRAEAMIRRAAEGGAQIVCTTECFLDGYAVNGKLPPEEFRALGERIPGGTYYERLAKLADDLNIFLVAGMSEADGDDRYNTAALISPKGQLVGKWRKHEIGGEAGHTPGAGYQVFPTPYGRMGLVICRDRQSAGLVKGLRDEGADFILCPSGGMFGPTRNDPIVQARSKENRLPIVFVHPAEFLVTGPDGEIRSRTILGDRLLISAADVQGEADQNGVYFYDLPVAQGKE